MKTHTLMTQKLLNFRTLLDPLPVDAFFDEHLNEAPAFVGGDVSKVDGFFGWSDVTAYLNNSKLWTSETLKVSLNGESILADQYCLQTTNRDLQRVWRPDSVMVLDYMNRGGVLTLEGLEALTPGLTRLTAALSSALGGTATARAICSAKTELANVVEFDVGDAFHVQLEGSSCWALYENRAGFSEEPGALAAELEMSAGDTLYLPSGQYYRAASTSDAAMWITVTVVRPSGLDLLSMFRDHLVDIPLFRTDMPAFDKEAEHRKQLATLADTISVSFSSNAFAETAIEGLKSNLHQSKVATFDLPSHDIEYFYRLRHRAVMPDGLDAVARAAARWAVETEVFTFADACRNFPKCSAGEMSSILSALRDCGFLEPANKAPVR
jgi:hypothetical protein